MLRFLATTGPAQRTKLTFWLGEVIAGCAFFLLVIALLFAPYLLGFLPEVDVEFMQGAR